MSDQISQVQFPLSLLRVLLYKPGTTRKKMAAESRSLAQRIVRYSYVSMALLQWTQQVKACMEVYGIDYAEAERYLEEMDRADVAKHVEEGELPYHFQTVLEVGRSVYRGLGWNWTDQRGVRHTEVTPQKWSGDLRSYNELQSQCIKKDGWVRIHQGIVWDLNEGRWDWLEFIVYCAVLSKLGDKKVPWVVHYDELYARAHGFLTKRSMPHNLGAIVTVDQIRYRLTKLEQRRLVRTFSKRHTRRRYYWLPFRISDEAAERYIAQQQAKVAGLTDKTAQRERIEDMTRAIQGKA